MLVTALAFAFIATNAPTPPHELYDYLRRPDKSFAYSEAKHTETPKPGLTEIDLTSQTWEGIPWKHRILIQQPPHAPVSNTAILYITGDGPRAGDYQDLALVSAATGMPVAMLFDIPNQPIFGLREDDLIANTFMRYLETKDTSWPLLFPMTKSALRAMDAVEAVTAKSSNPLKHFVVTGASKRGWTTWFVGAAKDPRVLGIAPMVYDNLNVGEQMKHQIALWGKYSEQIEAYTKLGLQQRLSTPEGQHLATIVDPFSYRANIKVPILMVTGANDPYWTTDSMSLYWDDLKQPKWASISPNAGHTLGTKIQAVLAIGAFARSIGGEFKMPSLKSEITESSTSGQRQISATVESSGAPLTNVQVWIAQADDLDFRPTHWAPAAQMDLTVGTDRPQKPTLIVPIRAGKNVAVLIETVYKVNGRGFTLSTPVKIFRKH